MKTRLLANENIPAPSIALLRSAGVDVLSIAQTHRAISDIEVLKLAREQCRWLLTYDLRRPCLRARFRAAASGPFASPGITASHPSG